MFEVLFFYRMRIFYSVALIYDLRIFIVCILFNDDFVVPLDSKTGEKVLTFFFHIYLCNTCI